MPADARINPVAPAEPVTHARVQRLARHAAAACLELAPDAKVQITAATRNLRIPGPVIDPAEANRAA